MGLTHDKIIDAGYNRSLGRPVDPEALARAAANGLLSTVQKGPEPLEGYLGNDFNETLSEAASVRYAIMEIDAKPLSSLRVEEVLLLVELQAELLSLEHPRYTESVNEVLASEEIPTDTHELARASALRTVETRKDLEHPDISEAIVQAIVDIRLLTDEERVIAEALEILRRTDTVEDALQLWAKSDQGGTHVPEDIKTLHNLLLQPVS